MSNFQWTDETVKEFILKECNKRNTWDEQGLNNYLSKFKDSKQAKDWEVVSFKSNVLPHLPEMKWTKDGDMYKNNFGSLFHYEDLMYSREDHNCVANGKMYINEVRRLPDNLIFTVGEVTNEGKIEKFQIEDDKYMMVHVKEFSVRYAIQELHKLPERKSLFRTEDNVDVFDGDKVWYVGIQTLNIGEHKAYNGTPYLVRCGSYLYFSTRSAAEEYVREHKPEISRKQIVKALLQLGYHHTSIDLVIKELHKQLNP